VVDRYAGEAFACYGHLRQLSPAQTRAELELFDDLVLITGLRPGQAGRWVATGSRRDRPAPVRPPGGGACRAGCNGRRHRWITASCCDQPTQPTPSRRLTQSAPPAGPPPDDGDYRNPASTARIVLSRALRAGR
jgi:hypothetical protein